MGAHPIYNTTGRPFLLSFSLYRGSKPYPFFFPQIGRYNSADINLSRRSAPCAIPSISVPALRAGGRFHIFHICPGAARRRGGFHIFHICPGAAHRWTTPYFQTEPNRNMRNSHFQTGPSGSPRSQGMVAPASLKTRNRQKRAVPTRGPLPLRPIATTLQFTPWLQLCEQPYLQRTNRNNTSSLGSNCVSSHICKGHSAKDIGCVRGGSGGGGSHFQTGFHIFISVPALRAGCHIFISVPALLARIPFQTSPYLPNFPTIGQVYI